MHIGVIGLGVIGSAIKQGFERLGNQTSGYDIKYPETSLNDILPTDMCFICVPTNSLPDGSCDTQIVRLVVRQLVEAGYKGDIIIKSTVKPGTSDLLTEEFHTPIVFCAEFLRERAALTDFLENQDICVIGTHDDATFERIKNVHGTLSPHYFKLSPTEAELVKYFSNTFNALRIIFANEFYEVCKHLGADYQKIKEAMVKRKTMVDSYLDCNENTRGFGGMCLPKDTRAMASLVRELGLDLRLFDVILEENKKFRTTLFEGMRSEEKSREQKTNTLG